MDRLEDGLPENSVIASIDLIIFSLSKLCDEFFLVCLVVRFVDGTFHRLHLKNNCSLSIMDNFRLNQCLSGVLLVIVALISDNGVRTDVNFKSKPTTIKTFENDSVLLPCYSTGRQKKFFIVMSHSVHLARNFTATLNRIFALLL